MQGQNHIKFITSI